MITCSFVRLNGHFAAQQMKKHDSSWIIKFPFTDKSLHSDVTRVIECEIMRMVKCTRMKKRNVDIKGVEKDHKWERIIELLNNACSSVVQKY